MVSLMGPVNREIKTFEVCGFKKKQFLGDRKKSKRRTLLKGFSRLILCNLLRVKPVFYGLTSE
jgi:hypothetical protein